MSHPSKAFERFTFGGFSILAAVRLGYFPDRMKRALKGLFCGDLGLGRRLADVLINHRSPKAIMMIFRQWESIIDGFALGFPESFHYEKTWRAMLRKYIGVASCSIQTTTVFYKDFVDQLKFLVLDPIMSKKPKGLHNNPFYILFEVFDGVDLSSKENYSRFAHVFSTRHLAPGSGKAIPDAIKSFKETLTSNFKVPKGTLEEFESAARRVVRICLSQGKPTNLVGAHLSISGSGAYNVPQSKGGKAAAMMADCRILLNEIPKVTRVQDVGPLGLRTLYADRRVWQSLDDSLGIFNGETPEWLEPEDFSLVDRPAPMRGVGSFTGNMIFYCAWMKYEEFKESDSYAPRVRMVTISEPGGKVRAITAAPWWLPTLMQPYTHVWADLLARHPSAHSVFRRQDQAWQALKVFQKIKHRTINDGFAFLSSDFKSATDNIPFEVSKTLLRVLEEETMSHLTPWASNLVGPRVIDLPNGDVINSSRGILMGEPFSKICLILSVLCAEEMAFSRHIGLALDRTWTPTTRWRAFHIGGDDHIAYGPLAYLRSLTDICKAIGFVISPSKHIVSRTAVTYTEKVFFFKGRIINMPLSEVNSRIEESLFCDSIKVRLLSPFSTVMDSRDDRNVAIGKARSLSASIQWLSGKYFEPLARYAVRRFQIRFADYVPSTMRRTMSAIAKLPPSLGGMGLAFRPTDDDYQRLPDIYRWAIWHISNGGPASYRVRSILSDTFSNRVVRTKFKYLEEFRAAIEAEPQIRGYTLREVKDRFREDEAMQGHDNVEFIHRLKSEGIISFTDFFRLLERPFRFARMIGDVATSKMFNTTPNRVRIAKTWDELESLKKELSSEEKTKFFLTRFNWVEDNFQPDLVNAEAIKSAARLARYDWFVDLNMPTTYFKGPASEASSGLTEEGYWNAQMKAFQNEDGWEMGESPLRDHILFNAPDLVLRCHDLNSLANVVNTRFFSNGV